MLFRYRRTHPQDEPAQETLGDGSPRCQASTLRVGESRLTQCRRVGEIRQDGCLCWQHRESMHRAERKYAARLADARKGPHASK